MSFLLQKLTARVRRNPLIAAPMLAAFLTGCSALNVLDVVVPAGEYDLRRGIPYGTLSRQRLDIYQPVAAEASGPVIVFFYGGSWKSGERGQYRFVGEALTRRGLTVIVPDYRLYPDVTFPAFMNDAARAVRWVRDNLRDTAGSPRPVFLAGHSAGAHIAALLAVDDRYLKAAGLSRGTVCGVIGLAGPYTFDPQKYRSTRRVFTGLENTDVARPARRISGATPPFLLLHGESDSTVWSSNTVEFAAALRAAGNKADIRLFPDIGHSRILLSISEPFDHIAPVNELISEFVRAQAGCGQDRRGS